MFTQRTICQTDSFKGTVAVGFNTSPTGDLRTEREVSYISDGYGEIASAGEAMRGPGGTAGGGLDCQDTLPWKGR